MKKNKNKDEKDKTLLVGDFNNSVSQIMDNYLRSEYLNLSKKLLKSKLLFFFLNLSSFFMSATIVILTMFVIGKKIGGKDIQMIFVSISILTSVITFVTGIDGIFRFKKRRDIYSKRLAELSEIMSMIEDEKTIKNKKIYNETIVDISSKLNELDNDNNI